MIFDIKKLIVIATPYRVTDVRDMQFLKLKWKQILNYYFQVVRGYFLHWIERFVLLFLSVLMFTPRTSVTSGNVDISVFQKSVWVHSYNNKYGVQKQLELTYPFMKDNELN
jgi:hypothetical protein